MSSQRSTCAVCGVGRCEGTSDTARVASNVRCWRDHVSTVWRCSACGSLHSLERVDLSVFYQDYPFNQRRLDNFTRRMFAFYLRRLKAHGLQPTHSILDYGCSQGLLLEYLRERGFTDCRGYDPYSQNYSDSSVLAPDYDAVICQDVIEHVEDPRQLLTVLSGKIRTGGLLCIGTPRADGIDLRKPAESIHSLHQPYHLHILSERALLEIAADSGLILEKLYRQDSSDTPYPFVNWAFLRAYLKTGDDTLDAGFERPSIGGLIGASPRLLILGLFGYLLSRPVGMIALLRKSGPSAAARR